MNMRYGLIVIGGGPAGVSAAIEAATYGVKTLLLDENPTAGGQVYRAQLPGLKSVFVTKEQRAGDALRAALSSSNVTSKFGQRVWMIESGFKVFTIGDEGPLEIDGDALIIATGAVERYIPIPGWTLPGVVGLAAATVLLKSQGMLPGHNVVVAGSGPLLPLVATGILKAGGKVAAVIDSTPPSKWLKSIPSLITRPDLMAQGAQWIGRLLLENIPVISGHAIVQIKGSTCVSGVTVCPLGSKGEPLKAGKSREFECDAVCYGFGLLSSTDATRLTGAAHVFDSELGGWRVTVDDSHRTTIPRIYAAGDNAGVLGAAAAPLRGRIAALSAVRELGLIDNASWNEKILPLKAELRRAGNFGRAMTVVSRPKQGMTELITPDTIVCRCEGITRETIDRAITDGCVTLNDLKSATRCGMGPCGSRVCSEPVSMLIAERKQISRESVEESTARPPLRPIPFDQLIGGFDYSDLPVPVPAPL